MNDGVRVHGHGDDLVIVEGAVTEEFRPGLEVEDSGVFIALSCGVLLHARYDGDWTIRVKARDGRQSVVTEPARQHDANWAPEYSDAVTVESDHGVKWAAMADDAVINDE